MRRIRRIVELEAEERQNQFEAAVSRSESKKKPEYIGYLFTTDEKGKWIGYINLQGRKYNIKGVTQEDTISNDPILQIEFTDERWLVEGGEQFHSMYRRQSKTWGGKIYVPASLREFCSREYVAASFHLNYPPAPLLKGKRAFAWRITQRRK